MEHDSILFPQAVQTSQGYSNLSVVENNVTSIKQPNICQPNEVVILSVSSQSTCPEDVFGLDGREYHHVEYSECVDVETADCEDALSESRPLFDSPWGEKKSNEDEEEEYCLSFSYELQQAYRILREIMSESNKSVTWPFIDAVDPEKTNALDYYDCVKNPIWLRKIKEKFLNKEYESITEFVGDMRLMLENCYRYNGPDHPISKKGQRMETMMEQKLALLSRELRLKTSIEATSGKKIVLDKVTGSRRRKALVPHDSTALLNQLRVEAQEKVKEARRQQIQERKNAQEAFLRNLDDWEDQLFEGGNKDQMKAMWEIPQIGHFLFLCVAPLNIGEVMHWELEHCFAMPRESSTMQRVMTTLLSTPYQRTSLDKKPVMPYEVWEEKLRVRVRAWYKVLNDNGGNVKKTSQKLGLDEKTFEVLGMKNRLEKKKYHELTFYQRVWLMKSLCDYCLETQESVREAIEGQPLSEQHEYLLGYDNHGNSYLHFPQFCGADLRLYRQSPVDMPSLDPPPPKNIKKPAARKSRKKPSKKKPPEKVVTTPQRPRDSRLRQNPRTVQHNVLEEGDTVSTEETESSQAESTDVDEIPSKTSRLDWTDSSTSAKSASVNMLRAGFDSTDSSPLSTPSQSRDVTPVRCTRASLRKELLERNLENFSRESTPSRLENSRSSRTSSPANSSRRSAKKRRGGLGGRGSRGDEVEGNEVDRDLEEMSNASEDRVGENKNAETELADEEVSVKSLPKYHSTVNDRDREIGAKTVEYIKTIEPPDKKIIEPELDPSQCQDKTVNSDTILSHHVCKNLNGEFAKSRLKAKEETNSVNCDDDSYGETKPTLDLKSDRHSSRDDDCDCRVSSTHSIDFVDAYDDNSSCMSSDIANTDYSKSACGIQKSGGSESQEKASVSDTNNVQSACRKDEIVAGDSLGGSGDKFSLGAEDNFNAVRRDRLLGYLEEDAEDAEPMALASNIVVKEEPGSPGDKSNSVQPDLKENTGSEVSMESAPVASSQSSISDKHSEDRIKTEDIKTEDISLSAMERDIGNASQSSGDTEAATVEKTQVKDEPGEESVKVEERMSTEDAVEMQAEDSEDETPPVLPDINDFKMVVDSVESLRILVKEFAPQEPTVVGQKASRAPSRKRCMDELYGRLLYLLKELEPWEVKLVQANKKAKIKMKKELENYVKVEKKEVEDVWESEPSASSSEDDSTSDEDSSDGAPQPQPIPPTSVQMPKQAAPKKPKPVKQEQPTIKATHPVDMELDVSSHGRIRKRRIIPNNVEDQIFKKRKPVSDREHSSSPVPNILQKSNHKHEQEVHAKGKISCNLTHLQFQTPATNPSTSSQEQLTKRNIVVKNSNLLAYLTNNKSVYLNQQKWLSSASESQAFLPFQFSTANQVSKSLLLLNPNQLQISEQNIVAAAVTSAVVSSPFKVSGQNASTISHTTTTVASSASSMQFCSYNNLAQLPPTAIRHLLKTQDQRLKQRAVRITGVAATNVTTATVAALAGGGTTNVPGPISQQSVSTLNRASQPITRGQGAVAIPVAGGASKMQGQVAISVASGAVNMTPGSVKSSATADGVKPSKTALIMLPEGGNTQQPLGNQMLQLMHQLPAGSQPPQLVSTTLPQPVLGILSPQKPRYANNVTVKALLENRAAQGRAEDDEGQISATIAPAPPETVLTPSTSTGQAKTMCPVKLEPAAIKQPSKPITEDKPPQDKIKFVPSSLSNANLSWVHTPVTQQQTSTLNIGTPLRPVRATGQGPLVRVNLQNIPSKVGQTATLKVVPRTVSRSPGDTQNATVAVDPVRHLVAISPVQLQQAIIAAKKKAIVDNAVKQVITTFSTTLPTAQIKVTSPFQMPSRQPHRPVTITTSAVKSPIPTVRQIQSQVKTKNLGRTVSTITGSVSSTSFPPYTISREANSGRPQVLSSVPDAAVLSSSGESKGGVINSVAGAPAKPVNSSLNIVHNAGEKNMVLKVTPQTLQTPQGAVQGVVLPQGITLPPHVLNQLATGLKNQGQGLVLVQQDKGGYQVVHPGSETSGMVQTRLGNSQSSTQSVAQKSQLDAPSFVKPSTTQENERRLEIVPKSPVPLSSQQIKTNSPGHVNEKTISPGVNYLPGNESLSDKLEKARTRTPACRSIMFSSSANENLSITPSPSTSITPTMTSQSSAVRFVPVAAVPSGGVTINRIPANTLSGTCKLNLKPAPLAAASKNYNQKIMNQRAVTPEELVNQPGLLNQPGAVNQPVTLNRPGVMHQPTILNQPGSISSSAVLNQPGPISNPGVLNQPGPISNPGVLNQPGPISNSGVLNQTGAVLTINNSGSVRKVSTSVPKQVVSVASATQFGLVQRSNRPVLLAAGRQQPQIQDAQLQNRIVLYNVNGQLVSAQGVPVSLSTNTPSLVVPNSNGSGATLQQYAIRASIQNQSSKQPIIQNVCSAAQLINMVPPSGLLQGSQVVALQGTQVMPQVQLVQQVQGQVVQAVQEGATPGAVNKTSYLTSPERKDLPSGSDSIRNLQEMRAALILQQQQQTAATKITSEQTASNLNDAVSEQSVQTTESSEWEGDPQCLAETDNEQEPQLAGNTSWQQTGGTSDLQVSGAQWLPDQSTHLLGQVSDTSLQQQTGPVQIEPESSKATVLQDAASIGIKPEQPRTMKELQTADILQQLAEYSSQHVKQELQQEGATASVQDEPSTNAEQVTATRADDKSTEELMAAELLHQLATGQFASQ